MTRSLREECTEDADSQLFPRPSLVPQLKLYSTNGSIDKSQDQRRFELQDVHRSSLDNNFLPPVHSNTARDQSHEKDKYTKSRSQTARIRFAPPPKAKQRASFRVNRAQNSTSSAAFCDLSSDLHQKQSATACSFKILENWLKTIESGALKTLLTEVHDVLFEAIYRKPDGISEQKGDKLSRCSGTELTLNKSSVSTEETRFVEYFSLLADVQEKIKLQQQEREQLTSRIAMENSMQQDLSTQLQQLERELAQLDMRHAYNRAEVETERRVVQHLEKDYTSLTAQEEQLQRECEVMEVQLETQRSQLKEIRSQQLYLDFVSSAPLRRQMEEKKWQEQHATVLLQVQNAETETRALEDEIKKLDGEILILETQYASGIETKVESEAALSEIQWTYEQFLESIQRTRSCYTPRPDWGRIVEDTPELSAQQYQWEMADSMSSRNVVNEELSDGDNGGVGVFEHLEDSNTKMVVTEEKQDNTGQTKTIVKEMLHWIARLQKHCGVNLHLSRIWHDVEEARVELNILHHQLDRAVRNNSMLLTPTVSGVSTIAATSLASNSPSKRRQDYIMALGTHEGVPMFLRHRGKLKRRILKKIEVEKVVRKVWVEKRKREQRNPLGKFKLDQVLYEKLHRKYGFQPLIAEWAYNLLLALQMFSWDSEIEMFLLCLTGAVSDLVYLDQEQMIQGCRQLLLRLCELYNVDSFVTEKRVLLKDALVALRTYFPLKTSVQLQAIEQAIIRDMHKMKRGGNDSILYIEDILPLNSKYPLGFFVKTLRTQHFKEIQDYYALLLSELVQRDNALKGVLPVAALRDAILAIDPLADPNVIQNLMMKTLNVKTRAQLNLREPIHYRAVLRKLNATCLMKFALNFDPNAEINWRRRPCALTVDLSTINRKSIHQ